MIGIEIKTGAVQERSGISKNSGKAWSMRLQEAWAHTLDSEGKPHPFPQRIEIQLRDKQEPYAPGRYTVAATSLYVGEFGKLSFYLRLLPVAQVKAA